MSGCGAEAEPQACKPGEGHCFLPGHLELDQLIYLSPTSFLSSQAIIIYAFKDYLPTPRTCILCCEIQRGRVYVFTFGAQSLSGETESQKDHWVHNGPLPQPS